MKKLWTVVFLGLCLLAGCLPPIIPAKFAKGDMVKFKLEGRTGMVDDLWYPNTQSGEPRSAKYTVKHFDELGIIHWQSCWEHELVKAY